MTEDTGRPAGSGGGGSNAAIPGGGVDPDHAAIQLMSQWVGGLLMATMVTLFIVPVVYTLLRVKPPMRHLLEERFQREKQGLEPDERHV